MYYIHIMYYPLVICYIAIDNGHNGKINYFDWAIFNSYVTNYQRVYK